MKRKIEDYKHKEVAIKINSIEEFDKIKALLGWKNPQKGSTCLANKNFIDKYCISCISDDYGKQQWFESLNYTILNASDFLEEECKFEVGKWYKNYNPPDYMKCISFDSNYMYGKEYISNNSYEKRSNNYSWDLKTQTLVTDLSEIQNVLPEGHPDKIKSSISFKFNINDKVKVKSGGCYISSPENWVKEKHESKFPSERYNNFDKIADRKHCQNLNWYKPFDCGNWITEDGLELVKTDIIPEYVELLPNFDSNLTGKIFDTTKSLPNTWIRYESWNWLLTNYHKKYFKPSTKKDYDLQGKPTINTLIPGEIYASKNDNGSIYIFKCSNKNYWSERIIGNGHFDKNDYFGLEGRIESNLRFPTIEEKKWLNTCITQDKFIPKEYLHLYDDSGLLISAQKCEECNDTGRVMKAKLYPSGHTEVWEDCEKCKEKKETMFKKEDYIVVLQKPKNNEKWISSNFIYKQLKSDSVLYVSVDNLGEITNTSDVRFDKPNTWRYATSKEIAEYERIGKPFDVTTLNKPIKETVMKFKIGDKVSFIDNTKGNAKFFEKGYDNLEIKSVYSSTQYDVWGSDKSTSWVVNQEELELTTKEKWIPKVGDWVVITQNVKEKGMVFKIKCQFNNLVGRWFLESSPYSYTNEQIRKALPHEIPNQYPLTPIECFKTDIYDLEDTYIPSITKKSKQIQTVTIESPEYLNLNLKEIKTNQIQTIKI